MYVQYILEFPLATAHIFGILVRPGYRRSGVQGSAGNGNDFVVPRTETGGWSQKSTNTNYTMHLRRSPSIKFENKDIPVKYYNITVMLYNATEPL